MVVYSVRNKFLLLKILATLNNWGTKSFFLCLLLLERTNISNLRFRWNFNVPVTLISDKSYKTTSAHSLKKNNFSFQILPFQTIFFFFNFKWLNNTCCELSLAGSKTQLHLFASLTVFIDMYKMQYLLFTKLKILRTYKGTSKHNVFFFGNNIVYWRNCFFSLLTTTKYNKSYFSLSNISKLFFWKRDLNLFPREHISSVNLFLYYFSFFTNNYFFKNTLNTFYLNPKISNTNMIFLKNNVLSKQCLYGSKKFYMFLRNISKKNNLHNLNRFKDLSVFQLKPGYKKLWKLYRRAHSSISPYSFFRQRRWTSYFLSISSANSTNLLSQLEFSLFWILYSCYFFFFQYSLLLFLFKKYIYVNGFLPNNPNFQIFLGDVIQFRADTSCILYLLKNNFYYLRGKKKTLFKFFFNLKKLYVINNGWQLKVNFFFDVPNYLEVDFLSLSVVPVYFPIFNFEQQPFISYYLPASAIKIYNWKYIN